VNRNRKKLKSKGVTLNWVHLLFIWKRNEPKKSRNFENGFEEEI